MKKRYVALVVLTVCLLATGCSSKKDNNKQGTIEIENIGVKSDVEKTTEEIASQDVTSDTQVETTTEEKEESEDAKCYVSEREVSQFKSDFPKDVCSDFSYFSYPNLDAVYKAQKHLQAIGVSIEDKKIVNVMSDDDDAPVNLTFFEYQFKDGKTYVREHYFLSNAITYQEYVDMVGALLDEADEEAFYVRTKFSEEPSITYESLTRTENLRVFKMVW